MQTAFYKKCYTTYSPAILPHVTTYEDGFPETTAGNNMLSHSKNMSEFFVRSPKILVVEDNLMLQTVFTDMLHSLGCKIDIADDGYEAISMSSKKSYDLIFMDIGLPKLDGLATTKIIRSRETDRKRNIIVAISAYGDLLEKGCLEAGMDDVCVKPVLLDGFLRLLTHWLPHLLLPNDARGH
ncbi:MAG: response regulator [Gammaproteobacteria bacterium]